MQFDNFTKEINLLTQIRDSLNSRMRNTKQDEYLIKSCNAFDSAIQNLSEYNQNGFPFQRIYSNIAKYLSLFNLMNTLVNLGITMF